MCFIWRFFKSEAIRYFRPVFFFTMIGGFLMLVAGAAEELIYWLSPNTSHMDREAYGLFTTGLTVGYFLYFTPALSVLPYATSLIADKESGYQYMVFTHIKREYYYIVKLICTCISGFVVALLSMALFILFCNTFSGVKFNTNFADNIVYLGNEVVLFGQRFGFIGYAMVWMIVSGVYGAWGALMGLVISFFTSNKILILSFPVFFVVISNNLLGRLGLFRFSPVHLSQATSWIRAPEFYIIYTLSLFLILFFVGYIAVRRKINA